MFRFIAAAILAASIVSGTANASERILAPDGTSIIVQKQVNQDAWSIVFSLTDLSLIGSVYVNGESPVFIYCAANNQTDGMQIGYDCVAGENWSNKFQVILPWSFFAPCDFIDCNS